MTAILPTDEHQQQLRQVIEDCLIQARELGVDPLTFDPLAMPELDRLRRLLAGRQAQGIAVGKTGPLFGLRADKTLLESLDTQLHSQWHDDASPIGCCERTETMAREVLVVLCGFGFDLPMPDPDSMLAESPRINGRAVVARIQESRLERGTAPAQGRPRTARF